MFQSMCRRSSPMTYGRWSANSTDSPRFLLRRSPLSLPEKTLREAMSSLPTRAMSSLPSRSSRPVTGLTPSLLSTGPSGQRADRFAVGLPDDLLDDRVRVDAVGLGLEVQDDAVTQAHLRHVLHV